METIQLLHARNTITRRTNRLEQQLVFTMLVGNLAWDKGVEVHWAGEDRVWHALQASYQGPAGGEREIWRAEATFHPSAEVSLPGDVEFALRCRMLGHEHWDNNRSRNYALNADSGVLLEASAQLAHVDFSPLLDSGCRTHPVTVAVRSSLRPRRVSVHWSTDGWRSAHVTPCQFQRQHWNRQRRRSSARNPNRYDTGIWACQMRVDDAYRVEYAIACEAADGTFWDNNFGDNYHARRRRLKILTLNLHCYQEEDQDAKFSRIAQAIDDLDIDVVCLQEVGELWCGGNGDWNSNAARIIRDRLRRHYHLRADWSHLGFERYREGIAILSRHGFRATDAGYVSPGQDPHSIDSRKVVMVTLDVPYLGIVNVFSVHLSWLSGGFLGQFERLRAWASEQHAAGAGATFLCGDFNIEAGSEGYRAVVRTQEYEDQFLAVTAPNLFHRVFRGPSPPGEVAFPHDGRIDYVMMHRQSPLVAIAARTLFTDDDPYGRVSDHVGYCVEFEPGA